jgi:hypothetical protein
MHSYCTRYQAIIFGVYWRETPGYLPFEELKLVLGLVPVFLWLDPVISPASPLFRTRPFFYRNVAGMVSKKFKHK